MENYDSHLWGENMDALMVEWSPGNLVTTADLTNRLLQYSCSNMAPQLPPCSSKEQWTYTILENSDFNTLLVLYSENGFLKIHENCTGTVIEWLTIN